MNENEMLSNELGMNVFFFKMAGGKSKHIELTEESRGNSDICGR